MIVFLYRRADGYLMIAGVPETEHNPHTPSPHLKPDPLKQQQ